MGRLQGKGGGGGGGHKGRWDPTDDGSEAQAVDGIADKGDPNYDSEADDHDNNYVLVSSREFRRYASDLICVLGQAELWYE